MGEKTLFTKDESPLDNEGGIGGGLLRKSGKLKRGEDRCQRNCGEKKSK